MLREQAGRSAAALSSATPEPAVPILEFVMDNNEERRLEELRSYQILDTLPEQAYDDITFLAGLICEAPIALMSFVDRDRQWFKSARGIPLGETPRRVAFCAQTIELAGDLLVIEDALRDPRFRDNPLVTAAPNIRFYAGAPLITARGNALGTICVIDRVPRLLDPQRRDALRALARKAMVLLELRRTLIEVQDKNQKLEEYQ
ncbi:MAG TPA: GAF domain-containing protein, partial [Steroidobacteraceae bacterium]